MDIRCLIPPAVRSIRCNRRQALLKEVTCEADRAAEEGARWRERAAMLERNRDETLRPGRPSRQGKRRRRVVLANFKLREVLHGPITSITQDGVYVHLHGLDCLVHLPELSWGDIAHPSQLCAVGQRVNVKVLSTPVHSQHPFLVLVWE